MDNKRFDSLTKALASGQSRRSVIKGLLGLGGAAAVSTVVTDAADARRSSITLALRPRPTTTRAAPCRPGFAPCTTNVTGCCAVCSGNTPVTCGLECCASDDQCCDGECCGGDQLCVAKVLDCSNSRCEEICCDEDQICDGRCCNGTCFQPIDELFGDDDDDEMVDSTGPVVRTRPPSARSCMTTVSVSAATAKPRLLPGRCTVSRSVFAKTSAAPPATARASKVRVRKPAGPVKRTPASRFHVATRAAASTAMAAAASRNALSTQPSMANSVAKAGSAVTAPANRTRTRSSTARQRTSAVTARAKPVATSTAVAVVSATAATAVATPAARPAKANSSARRPRNAAKTPTLRNAAAKRVAVPVSASIMTTPVVRATPVSSARTAVVSAMTMTMTMMTTPAV